MKSYKMDMGIYNGVFAAPNSIVDEYLKLASGNSVKVLLVILRYSGEAVSSETISKLTGISQGEVNDALLFWEQLEVIEEGISEAVVASNIVSEANIVEEKASIPNTKEVIVEEPPKEEKDKRNVHVLSNTPYHLSQEEATKRYKEDEQVQFLIDSTRNILEKEVSGVGLTILVTLYDYHEIPVDVILMLIHFCKQCGETSWKQIESQVIHCKDLGFVTHEQVDEYLKDQSQIKNYQKVVKSMFGINRKLGEKEESFISDWFIKYKSNKELLSVAFERCIERTGNVSFPYIDAILKNWSEKNITTREEAESEENPTPYAGKISRPQDLKKGGKKEEERKYKNTSYDIDEMEKTFLYRTPKI